MFQKKIDRAFSWLKEKNRPQNSPEVNNDNPSELERYDPKAEWKAHENENMDLEKNDVLAIIISALLVFGPILLILLLALWLVYRSLYGS